VRDAMVTAGDVAAILDDRPQAGHLCFNRRSAFCDRAFVNPATVADALAELR
jgi:hypothetical protein